MATQSPALMPRLTAASHFRVALAFSVWMVAIGVAWAEHQGLPGEALNTIRHLAILHNGRVKPFDSYAREALKAITGSPTLRRQDPVATLLSIAALPSEWAEVKLISIPFVPLRAQLGLQKKINHVSYNELILAKGLLRMLPAIAEKQSRDEKLTILDAEAMDLYERFVAFTQAMQQDFRLVPPAGAGEEEWIPILQSQLKESWEMLVAAFNKGETARLLLLTKQVEQAARGSNPKAYPKPWRLALEVLYNRARPFTLASTLYGIAAVLLLIGIASARIRASHWGLNVLIGSGAVHATGILIRVVIGARPPVSNFYETMLMIPFVGVVLALVFERIYLPAPLPQARQAGHARYFALSASLLAAIILVLADAVPLDSSISPVVAVLRSNLWLTVHVLTIVASYGALALASVLAHIYGVLFLRRRDEEALAALDTFLYRTIQVGVVLLASGIMLGAVWANASWGRYWGWDPKETWALITLLWFLAVLHGRFAGWLNGVGVCLSTIGGFLLLLITYYGVSFYLVGLHSYAGGHARPPPPLLLAYLIAELAFLLVVGLTALICRRLALRCAKGYSQTA